LLHFVLNANAGERVIVDNHPMVWQGMHHIFLAVLGKLFLFCFSFLLEHQHRALQVSFIKKNVPGQASTQPLAAVLQHNPPWSRLQMLRVPLNHRRTSTQPQECRKRNQKALQTCSIPLNGAIHLCILCVCAFCFNVAIPFVQQWQRNLCSDI